MSNADVLILERHEISLTNSVCYHLIILGRSDYYARWQYGL